jgi:hypothetical protein
MRPGMLHRNWGMLMLNAFKSYLTPQVKSAIHAMNTDLVVIHKWMTTQLQVLE